MAQAEPQPERETDRYRLVYAANAKTGRMELTLYVKAEGKHKAVHTSFNLPDDDGKLIEKRPITAEVAAFIMEHFERRGDTESLNIHTASLAAERLGARTGQRITPEDVRHTMTNTEKSFTATGAKLEAHWPIFEKLRDTGYGSLIRATMTNHQVCSSRCQFMRNNRFVKKLATRANYQSIRPNPDLEHINFP